MSRNDAYPLDLECGHRLWYPKTRARPSRREKLWCKSCQSVCKQMDAVIGEGRITWPDGWISEPIGNKIIALCNSGCEYSVTQESFRKAEQLMFQHLAIDHGGSTLLTRHTFTRPPLTDKAPF